MSTALAGKSALVTGSSAGLGAGIAKRLAADGARVCVHGRNEARAGEVAEAIRAAGGDAHVAIGSLSSDAEAARVADAVAAALGDIDILVNNAGGESAGNGQGVWFDIDPQTWLATYNSNVGSMVRMIRRFTPAMKARGWGRVIQLSSNVVDTPMAIIPDYQAAKAAIRALTRSLAVELAATGVTVNSVSPGLILSHGVENWLRGQAAEQGWGDDWAAIEAHAARDIAPNHSGRIGRPEEVAAAVAYLADPTAGFVNGTDMRVDGGV